MSTPQMTDISYYKDSVELTTSADTAKENATDRLFLEYMKRSNSADSPSKTEGGVIESFGFPSVDFTGFKQEAPYKSNDMLDAVWHGIRHIFSKDETVSEKVRSKIESQMSQQERQQFEQEEKALQKYKAELREQSTRMTLESGTPPQRPDCPMHDVIEKRLRQAENEIERTVRAHMPPAELRELDKQLKEYKAQVNEFLNPKDPLSAAMLPMPEPGPAIREYYKRIAKGAEEYMRTYRSNVKP